MSRSRPDLPLESPPVSEALAGSRHGPEQVALANAWRAVDDAVRSIFELARSLEFLGDAIRHFDADPMLDFREAERGRTRFWMDESPAIEGR